MKSNFIKTQLLFFVLAFLVAGFLQAQTPNNALDFGGTSDRVALGDLGNFTDWTIETWFKNNGTNNYENLFHSVDGGGNSGIRMELSSNYFLGHLYVYGTSGNYTIVPLSENLTNDWHHVAVVGNKTNNKFYIYLDGVKRVDANPTNWLTSFPNFVLGRGFSVGGERDYNGKL